MRTLFASLVLLGIGGAVQAQVCDCPPIDDQSCYETPRRNTLRPPVPLSIVDRFGSMTANATDIHRVCAPTNKNDDCPTCPTQADHFAGATLKQVVSTATPQPLTIRYQFGDLVGTLNAAGGFLLTPAGKSLTFPAPPPVLGQRNYNCYRVDATGGAVTGHAHTVDQFTVPGGYDVDLDPGGPWTLCVPANVDGSDPTAPADPRVFLCNLVNDDPKTLPFADLTVWINSALTGQRKLELTRYDDLCMPATIL